MYVHRWGGARYKSQGFKDVASKVGVSNFLGKTVTSDEWRNKYVWPYTNQVTE